MRNALMRNEDKFRNTEPIAPYLAARDHISTHPAWSAFIKYCSVLKHGEIELLKVQDGLPVLAEVTRKKVKFVP
jgi:hypothetical protein